MTTEERQPLFTDWEPTPVVDESAWLLSINDDTLIGMIHEAEQLVEYWQARVNSEGGEDNQERLNQELNALQFYESERDRRHSDFSVIADLLLELMKREKNENSA